MKIKSKLLHLTLERKAQIGEITADVLVMAFISGDRENDIDFDADEISYVKVNGVFISNVDKLFSHYDDIGVNLKKQLRKNAIDRITLHERMQLREMWTKSFG